MWSPQGRPIAKQSLRKKNEDTNMIIQNSALNREKDCVEVSSEEAEDSYRRTKTTCALKKRDNE